jgi:hypothetical protein
VWRMLLHGGGNVASHPFFYTLLIAHNPFLIKTQNG